MLREPVACEGLKVPQCYFCLISFPVGGFKFQLIAGKKAQPHIQGVGMCWLS